jgi:anaerobic selenocysteine-containing dehydrogenase
LKQTKNKSEKTVIISLSFGGVSGGGTPCAVDVKDGKIVRIRPLHLDWKYDIKRFNPWTFKVRGKVFKPLIKTAPPPFALAYKKRVYSPNRIKYPLKRVDWNPGGERNTQNRGKSKYQRISWDEAAELVTSELKRVKEKYGPLAVLAQVDGHGECKTVHSPHGCPTLLLSQMGGYTQQCRNADSWEGWYWGAKHVWGNGSVGMMSPSENTMKDMTENSEMVLIWGGDPETTHWGFTGQSATGLLYFWSEIGIKQVYICPELNYSAAIHADKWIPVLPNTDAALQLAIIYTWISEGTYDKEYVKTHTVGMDKVEDYVMGKEDGIPKTPAWAEPKCGVPEWTIKALAREFASKVTSIGHYFGGGMIRGPYSHEPARLEAILLGMQGLGKPGVHQSQICMTGMPQSVITKISSIAQHLRPSGIDVTKGKPGPWNAKPRLPTIDSHTLNSYSPQFIPKTLLQEAILNPPISFWGSGAIIDPTEGQFVQYTYPISREKGGTEIHMIWTDTPCRTTCWGHGHKTLEALRSPKIECIVAQHPWLENDCLAADIILPVCTTFELEDILPAIRQGGEPYLSMTMQKQAIPHIGESKSDYEAVVEVSKKLGLEDEVTEGKTVQGWIKHMFFDHWKLAGLVDWDELNEKGYYVFPTDKDWEKAPPGFREFYEDPVANPLPTPSGKLEFYSERLAKNFPDDKERPPIPKWIEKGVNHDERLSGERAKKYPLLQMSNHGRWRVHAQHDDNCWTREALTGKVKGWDGYNYEPLWMSPQDAEKRGIKSGDIVKSYNERGAVLGGAYVTERMRPSVVYMDHGARCDWIIPGELDRGGAINLISPYNLISKNCNGMATSGYLVEVEKVSMEQMEAWRRQYPEAFEREYDPASGLRFNAWVEEDSM